MSQPPHDSGPPDSGPPDSGPPDSGPHDGGPPDASPGGGRPPEGWRIDDLAHRAGLTVDTIRFYQREGLLPPAARAGRAKLYTGEHLDRLERIRDLQHRRFSLAAIRALLEAERPGLLDGIFGGEGVLSYSLDELVARSGLDHDEVDQLRDVGLLRDPAEFGRDAYDGNDLDVLRAVADIVRLALPMNVVAELASIYVTGVEQMQRQVMELFAGERGERWDDGELVEFQQRAASTAGALLPLVSRMVEYVHQRTLQRLTLGAMARAAGENEDESASDAG